MGIGYYKLYRECNSRIVWLPSVRIGPEGRWTLRHGAEPGFSGCRAVESLQGSTGLNKIWVSHINEVNQVHRRNSADPNRKHPCSIGGECYYVE